VGLGHKISRVKKVPVWTLAEALKAFNKPVDVLSIDTDGMDLAILNSNDWEKYRPKIILAEIAEYHGKKAVRVNKPFDELMKAKGYFKLADNYINGIYMEKEYALSQDITDILN